MTETIHAGQAVLFAAAAPPRHPIIAWRGDVASRLCREIDRVSGDDFATFVDRARLPAVRGLYVWEGSIEDAGSSGQGEPDGESSWVGSIRPARRRDLMAFGLRPLEE